MVFKEYGKYEWELTLTAWDVETMFTRLDMGYVDVPIDKTVTRYDVGLMHQEQTEQYQHRIIMLDMMDIAYINLPMEHVVVKEIAKVKIKRRDKFKLLFDHETGNATFHHNDKELCVAFRDLPDEFVPAVGLERCSVDCSTFRAYMCLD